MTLSIIVAVAQNGVIGGENRLLWHIPDDLKRFKQLTSGHSVIMGRKTYESIGRPLPNRRNIVITRNSALQLSGCELVGSLEEALNLTKNEDEVFVIGGGEIYRQALPLARMVYLTRVWENFSGDTHFPDLDPVSWELISDEKKSPAKGPGYSFRIYRRKED